MKFTLRTLPITILCVSLACAAALAQVQPSPSGPVRSRGFGLPISKMKVQTMGPASHPAQSPGSPDISLTFGMVDFPGQMDSEALSINDKGAIVGGYGTNIVGFGVSNNSFLLKGTKFTEIAYPGAAFTEANGINYYGVIVGQHGISFSDDHGFKLVGTTYTTIDYPGATDTSASAINKSGEIVGVWGDSGGGVHGFLLSKGAFTSIDVSGASATLAYGINDTGEIVGWYSTTGSDSHGFLYSGGTFTTIDYPGGYSQNYLSGINDKGVIVGAYGEPTTVNGVEYQWEHGFVYQSGVFTNADAPFGPPAVTLPFQINNNGVIVGEYVDNSDTVYGYEVTVGP
jgi:probable HAF family extracellular repeat protein